MNEAQFELTADQALEIAKSFLNQSGVQQVFLDAVRRILKEKQWRVVVRIGSIFGPQKEVIIDDETRKVVSYGDARAPPGPR